MRLYCIALIGLAACAPKAETPQQAKARLTTEAADAKRAPALARPLPAATPNRWSRARRRLRRCWRAGAT